jgi:hypothetical protein
MRCTLLRHLFFTTVKMKLTFLTIVRASCVPHASLSLSLSLGRSSKFRFHSKSLAINDGSARCEGTLGSAHCIDPLKHWIWYRIQYVCSGCGKVFAKLRADKADMLRYIFKIQRDYWSSACLNAFHSILESEVLTSVFRSISCDDSW